MGSRMQGHSLPLAWSRQPQQQGDWETPSQETWWLRPQLLAPGSKVLLLAPSSDSPHSLPPTQLTATS